MPIPAPILVGSRRDFSIEILVFGPLAEPSVAEERRLLNLVLPPWQRPEVWNESQKRRFVEGIFLGLGTGMYVRNGMDWERDGNCLPMSGWLIDGQQRITALRDFIDGKLVIFNDVIFTKMDKPARLRFLNTPFPCFELDYCNDERVLMDLYDRMNFGGTPHAPEQRVGN